MDINIVVLLPDNERRVIIMRTSDCIQRTRELLIDAATYRLLDTDPTAKQGTRINKNMKKIWDIKRIIEGGG